MTRWQSSRNAEPSNVSVIRRVVRTSSFTPSRSSSASMPAADHGRRDALGLRRRGQASLRRDGDECFDLLEAVHDATQSCCAKWTGHARLGVKK